MSVGIREEAIARKYAGREHQQFPPRNTRSNPMEAFGVRLPYCRVADFSDAECEISAQIKKFPLGTNVLIPM